MKIRLDELAKQIGAELRGVGSRQISGCAGLEDAGPDDLSFFVNRRYIKSLSETNAAAVIVGPDDVKLVHCPNLLVAGDPYFAFRQAMVAMYGFRTHPDAGIGDQVLIDPSAHLGQDCCIQPLVYVAARARIGDRCVIYPHCYIGSDVVIGDDCTLHPNVTIYDRCILADRVTVHGGCVIGQDGFGYATRQGAHHKIPQIGNVVIEEDVELGANCAIDRATVGSTRIGKGSKLSNLVAVGHGTRVGPHNLLVAQVGLAGSVQTGTHVSMGGQVGVAGHLKIGDMAQLAAKSGVMTDVADRAQVGGIPAMSLTKAKRNVLALRKLPALVKELKKLQQRVSDLKANAAQLDKET